MASGPLLLPPPLGLCHGAETVHRRVSGLSAGSTGRAPGTTRKPKARSGPRAVAVQWPPRPAAPLSSPAPRTLAGLRAPTPATAALRTGSPLSPSLPHWQHSRTSGTISVAPADGIPSPAGAVIDPDFRNTCAPSQVPGPEPRPRRAPDGPRQLTPGQWQGRNRSSKRRGSPAIQVWPPLPTAPTVCMASFALPFEARDLDPAFTGLFLR